MQSISDIKLFFKLRRWQAIQKHWERAFSGNLEHITFKTELNASSKMLLHFLKENSNTVHNTSTSPMRSAAILQYQSVIYPGIDGSSANTTNKCKDDQRCSRDEEGVEEDMLADSDEEDGPKDLDWHLGRLTKRQSVLSQWSRSLSSTAAIYCGGRKSLASSSSSSIRSAKERQTKCQDQGQMKQKQQQQSQSKIAVASANQALQPQRVQEAVSTAALQLPSKASHLSQHELLQQQRQYQQPEMYREHTMSRKEQSVRGHKAGGNVNLSCSIAGQSYEAAITTEALNLSGSISARERNSTTSSVLENLPRDNFSMDFADSQFEFTNFSNITMILDNARALMDGHNSNSDVINSTTTNYNNNNSNNIKEYVAPDSRIEGRPLRPTMYEENFSGYRSPSQLATVNDLNGSRHIRQKGSSRIEAVGMCVSKNTRLEPVRGLFAAVMSETNSDRSGPTHHI